MASIILAGTFTVHTNAVQLPFAPANKIKLKASSGNSATIYVGGDRQLTTGNGYELAKSETTDWMTLDNLNKLYVVGSNHIDVVEYLIQL